MEQKLITDMGEFDLQPIKFSTQENNSRVSDQKFSKFMLPFEFYATQDFLEKYGDYVSYEAINLKNEIPCFLVLEGKIHDAKLFIQKIQGFNITAQIDYGFEELPNFDKKLSELPFEKFQVPDIHIFAKEICEKRYPETVFNFPRIYTKKYPVTDEVWKNFDGYYNDLKKDGTEMRRNYVDEVGGIWNVNIIHPCVHPLHILKIGFLDAGLTLEGDILTETNLQKKWVFSGTEYFSSLTQKRLGLVINPQEYDYQDEKGYGYYNRSVSIPQENEYRVTGFVKINFGYIKIFLNNSVIYQIYSSSFADYHTFEFTAIIPANSTIKVESKSGVFNDQFDPIIQMELIGKVLYDNPETSEGGEDLGVITNLNKVDLSRAVPAMTFGEYVNGLTNWFNYDIEIKNKTVIMNKIQTEEIPKGKDFQFMEVPADQVSRTLLNKKSFLLKFVDLDEGFTKNSMFYDSNGPLLNGKEKKETSIIEANGYAMELRLPKQLGYLTANVMKDTDSTIALVEYDGLVNGQNNATYSPGCDHPELFENYWGKFLRIRINAQEFQWQKNCSISQISQYSVKDFIFCYNNIHLIKTISKQKVGNHIYNIELTTETVV